MRWKTNNVMDMLATIQKETAQRPAYTQSEIYDCVIAGLKGEFNPPYYVDRDYRVSIISSQFLPSFVFSFEDETMGSVSLKVRKTQQGVMISIGERDFSNLLPKELYFPEAWAAIQAHKKSHELFLNRWK